MGTPSRETLFKKMAALRSCQDDLPGDSIERIFVTNGQNTGKHETEEALFRMALEIKIFRLKAKLGYVQ